MPRHTHPLTTDDTFKDKHGDPIHEGDHVDAGYPRGSQEGMAERFAWDARTAEMEGVKHPPKVVFHDRHGHKVAHHPHSLEKKEA